MFLFHSLFFRVSLVELLPAFCFFFKSQKPNKTGWLSFKATAKSNFYLIQIQKHLHPGTIFLSFPVFFSLLGRMPPPRRPVHRTWSSGWRACPWLSLPGRARSGRRPRIRHVQAATTSTTMSRTQHPRPPPLASPPALLLLLLPGVSSLRHRLFAGVASLVACTTAGDPPPSMVACGRLARLLDQSSVAPSHGCSPKAAAVARAPPPPPMVLIAGCRWAPRPSPSKRGREGKKMLFCAYDVFARN
jgi:hypothetical protein